MFKAKLLIPIVIFSILSLSSYALDYKFKGKIIDKKNEPVNYANIIAKDMSNKFIKGTLSDSTGYFELNLEKGEYNILIKSILYKEHSFKVVLDKDVNLTKLVILEEDIHQLKEVEITAQVPKIRFNNGTYTVDVKNSIQSIGNTANSLIDKLPGVYINNGSIFINGKRGGKIYLNERLVNLSDESLLQYLQSIRSENIDKIEILPNPSSEYSAEGVGGVIRIFTKQREDGFSITTSLKLDIQRFTGVSPFFSLQYNKGKFGYILNTNGQKAKWLLFSDTYSNNLVNATQYNTHKTDTIFDKNFTINQTFYYDFDKKNKLALNTNGRFNKQMQFCCLQSYKRF